MAEQKKIGVDAETKALVGQIAEAESRSEAGQIRHWAKTDAKRLAIGTKIVPKRDVPAVSDLANAPTNTNKAKSNDTGNDR